MFRGYSLFINALKALMEKEYPRSVWFAFTIFVRKFELSFTFHTFEMSHNVTRGLIPLAGVLRDDPNKPPRKKARRYQEESDS